MLASLEKRAKKRKVKEVEREKTEESRKSEQTTPHTPPTLQGVLRKKKSRISFRKSMTLQLVLEVTKEQKKKVHNFS